MITPKLPSMMQCLTPQATSVLVTLAVLLQNKGRAHSLCVHLYSLDGMFQAQAPEIVVKERSGAVLLITLFVCGQKRLAFATKESHLKMLVVKLARGSSVT